MYQENFYHFSTNNIFNLCLNAIRYIRYQFIFYILTGMFKDCSLENSIEDSTWLTFKRSPCNIVLENKSNRILTMGVKKQTSQILHAKDTENLSLLGNYLTILPNRFSQCLTNLVHLDLSNSRLNDLPNALNVLRQLVYLNIDSNRFCFIPNIVSELTSLKTLTACNNYIKDVPNNLENLTNLGKLDLSSNKLRDLPCSYLHLNQLKSLSLANNRFKIIPSSVESGMHNLQEFTFSRNSCSEINVSPKSIKLTTFYAEQNGTCPSFPRWILNSRYKNLDTVSLNNTVFQTFDLPEEQATLNIKVLSMKQCQLFETNVEKLVARMIHLERLIIGNSSFHNGNGFWFMPINSLKEPSNLKEIDVSGTQIPQVPKEMINFVNLTVLNISSNNISYIPEEICSLIKLKCLIIDKNNLTTLPKNIERLISLNELKACQNHLCELPDTLETLNSLQYIDLYDNEFETVPEVLKKLPGLIGLDLEQNYFLTNDLLCGRYEIMRANLRDHWKTSYRILNGIKIKPPEALEEVLSERTWPISSLSSSLTDLSLDNSCKEGGSCSSADSGHMHWDTSEDSADDFDPNEGREPKIRTYPPFTFYRPFQRIYCPADRHPKRVKLKILKMLQEGTLVWPTNYAEGQFDDP
ncbi:uncharacterized protein LOC117224510 isoform X1 [Megalopta genalis]|uniref:uncharacterized protein LOC117224510 isoform X1 n=2 Tax=Megalopta genalis TaxID=115081 RepID=UPI003FD358DF